MPAPRISKAQWSLHKEEIYQLYVGEEKTLECTMNAMAERHDFSPTKAQYVRQLEKWDMKKNIKTKEWGRAADLIEMRASLGKDTQVLIDGRLLPEKRLKKGLGRPEVRKRHTKGYARSKACDVPRDIIACSPTLEVMPLEGPSQNTVANTSLIPIANDLFIILPFFQVQWLFKTPTPEFLEPLIGQTTELGQQLTPIIEALENKKSLKLPERIEFLANKQQQDIQTEQLTFFQPYFSLLRWAVYMSSNNLLTNNQKDQIVELIDTSGFGQGIVKGLDRNNPSMEIFASQIFGRATSLGKLGVVRALLDAGVSPNLEMPDMFGNTVTALFRAVSQSDVGMVDLLLRRGADPGSSGESLSTALDRLSRGYRNYDRLPSERNILRPEGGVLEIIKLIMNFEKQPSLKFIARACDFHDRLPGLEDIMEAMVENPSVYGLEAKLQYALCSGDDELFYNLLQAGANPNCMLYKWDGNTRNLLLMSPITLAAKNGNLRIATALLNDGVDPNRTASFAECAYYSMRTDFTTGPEKSALYYAAQDSNLAMIRLLISHGADPTSLFNAAQVKTILSPFYNEDLFNAISANDIYTLHKLVQQGADLNSRRVSDGRRPLEVALKDYRQERSDTCINLFIEHGADVNAKNVNGVSIFATMVKRCVHDLVHLGLRHGGDVNAKDIDGVPIFTKIIDSNNLDLIQSALRHGADITLIRGLCLKPNDNDFANKALILLNHGADINGYCPKRRTFTFLELAVAYQDFAMVLFLLENGTDPTKVSPNKPSIIQRAIQSRNMVFAIKMLEVLLAHGAGINSYHDVTLSAQNVGNLYKGQCLPKFETSFDMEYRTVEMLPLTLEWMEYPFSLTPFQIAAISASMTYLLSFLHQNGAEINAPPASRFGFTALQIAILGNRTQVVQFLLDLKADFHGPAALEFGCTALQAAILADNQDLAERFLDAGADVNIPASRTIGFTALQASILRHHTTLVYRLLKENADVNAQAASDGGRTALQAAALEDDYDLVKTLLDQGADANAPAPEKRGATALQFAAIRGEYDILALLLEHGAKVSAEPSQIDGRTAIGGAAEHGRLDMVMLLLENLWLQDQPFIDSKECEQAAQLAEKECHPVVAREIRLWVETHRMFSGVEFICT